MHTIALRRVYDEPIDDDSLKILVDRLWPRGISHENAFRDHRMKDIAPSTELRQRFDHEVAKRDRFVGRYNTELKHNPAIEELKKLWKENNIVLLYGSKDTKHNQAIVLKQFLEKN